jgi:hypothetical protein
MLGDLPAAHFVYRIGEATVRQRLNIWRLVSNHGCDCLSLTLNYQLYIPKSFETLGMSRLPPKL